VVLSRHLVGRVVKSEVSAGQLRRCPRMLWWLGGEVRVMASLAVFIMPALGVEKKQAETFQIVCLSVGWKV
jgi:hypothetical protein